MPARRPPCPIGAHVPVRGGLAAGGLGYADEVGAEAVQVFIGSPRGWTVGKGDPADDAAFVAGCAERSIPAFIHAPYLVNFGSPTPKTLDGSTIATAHALTRGVQIGAVGVVVHAGSAVGADRDVALKQVREHLLPLLDAIPDDGPRLLIEPTAGQGPPGAALAARMADLGPYFEVLDHHPRLGVCLDTCHAFAAGHDLTAPGGARKLVTALHRAVGKDRLGLVHANDSVFGLDSRRDRHADVGTGAIGFAPFADLLRLPALRGIPFVTETPHAATDIETLKALRDGTTVPG